MLIACSDLNATAGSSFTFLTLLDVSLQSGLDDSFEGISSRFPLVPSPTSVGADHRFVSLTAVPKGKAGVRARVQKPAHFRTTNGQLWARVVGQQPKNTGSLRH